MTERASRMRAPARRASLMAAGLDVFAEHGYAASSLGAVAGRAGVARAVLYDHFPSKRALYLAVLAEQNATLVARIGSGINSEGGPRERLRATVERTIEFARQHPAGWRLLQDSDIGDAEIRAVHRGHLESRVREVATLLAPDLDQAGVEAGSVEAQLLVEMIGGGLSAVLAWWQRQPDVRYATVVDTAERLLWSGLSGLRAR